jgi:hypothetical protein
VKGCAYLDGALVLLQPVRERLLRPIFSCCCFDSMPEKIVILKGKPQTTKKKCRPDQSEREKGRNVRGGDTLVQPCNITRSFFRCQRGRIAHFSMRYFFELRVNREGGKLTINLENAGNRDHA